VQNLYYGEKNNMSAFTLKIIALITMIIDHVAVVLVVWDLIPVQVTSITRDIGRLSFPIFAYMIANGWQHTRSKKKYFSMMVLFACISQIPYTLTFYPVNQMQLRPTETAFHFPYYSMIQIAVLSIFIVLSIAVYYFLILKMKKELSLVFLIISLAIAPIYLKLFNVWFLSSELNIFYTLALGIYAIYCWDLFIPLQKRPLHEYALLLPLIMFCLFMRPDYGVAGVALILALYIFQNKWMKCAAICAWGMLFYGFGLIMPDGMLFQNWNSAIATVAVAIFLLLYNGKKGFSMKIFFYTFYPAHLMILGAVNIYFRLFH
jgi:hypothetical protein